MHKLALADFDRDEILDLAVACLNEARITTYRGNGRGGFAKAAETLRNAPLPRGMLAADLNQDGVFDLAIGEPGGVAILIGNGDLTFSTSTQSLRIATSSGQAQTVSIVSADFNGDGISDLATANPIYDDHGSVFLGTGGGRFGPETRLSARGRPMDLIAIDLNRDGRPDLAFACQEGLTVLKGRGDGSFDLATQISIDAQAMSVAAADLNADGNTDLVLGGYYGGVNSVLLNNGDATFRTAGTVWSLGDVFSLLLADLNGDARTDLVAASYSGQSALYALGVGNGEFEPPNYFGTDMVNSFALRTANLDADRAGDLSILAERRKTVTLLRSGLTAVTETWWKEYPLDASFGDFDGDGIADLLVASVRVLQDAPEKDRGASIQFLRGRGDGTLEQRTRTIIEKCPVIAGQSYSTVGGGRLLALIPGDFNGDGALDVAVKNVPAGEYQIYRGNGDGSFRLVQSLPIGQSAGLPLNPISGEWTGDGIVDLAFAAASITPTGPAAIVSIFAATRDGVLQESSEVEVCSGSVLRELKTGDFDGNRAVDIAVNCGTRIEILQNNGQGRLVPASSIQADTNRMFTGELTVADFDQDGRGDIAAVSDAFGNTAPSSSVLLLLNTGDGNFRTAYSSTAALGKGPMVAVDFDGDSQLDLAIMNGQSGRLNILRNISAGPQPGGIPRIGASGVAGAGLSSPPVLALSPGSIATVFGENFAPAGTVRQVTAADLQNGRMPTKFAGVCVYVADIAAPIYSVLATQITFQVPEIPTAALAGVRVVTGCGTAQQNSSNSERVPVQSATPEFFYFLQTASRRNPIAAVNALTGQYIGSPGLIPGAVFVPAKSGDVLTLYFTGGGATAPSVAPGEFADRATKVAGAPVVSVGDVTLSPPDILYVGLTPRNPGLYQANIRIPASVAQGDLTVTLTIGGVASPQNGFLTIAK